MQKYVIALYIRLSIEDYKYDSLSVENQSLVLHEYAASMPEALNAEVMEFIDNGYSGTNFERPQVQKLIERLIDRIEVSHNKQITVRYRFQSEFETYAEVLEQCRNM